MKLLQFLAWSVFFLCIVLTDAVAALSEGQLMEWNISVAPLLYAVQPPDGLNSDDFRILEGATFSFTGARTGDARQSAIALSNAAGNTDGRLAKPAAIMLPVIAVPPHDQTAFVDGFAWFSVAATGSEPLTYAWLKNGDAIPGVIGSTLTLNNVQVTDAGQYTAVVSNDAGSVESIPATLTVKTPSIPPTIVNQPQDQTTTIGASASFSVSATGAEPLTYQWFKNELTIPGETSSRLTLNNVQSTDAGIYTVVVSNTNGSVTSTPTTIQINLAMAPIFENPAWSQTNGFTATLSWRSQSIYRIQMSTNLVDWLELTSITATGELTQILDPNATNAPQRFYRAVLQNSATAP